MNAGANSQKSLEEISPFTFGRYPQTSTGKDMTPIEWIVLDRQGDKALLISKYGLDCMPYNNVREDITWENCSLRGWLNKEFLKKAFNDAEQEVIEETMVKNSDIQGYSEWKTSGGINTHDRIFLLSYAEAKKYFNVKFMDENIKSRVAPTAYSKKRKAWTKSGNKTEDDVEAAWWWLRSPGSKQSDTAFVDSSGSLKNNHADSPHGCIRPVLWINLAMIHRACP